LIASSLTSLATSLILYLYWKPTIPVNSQGFHYALVGGTAGSLALIAFYSALGVGKASVVVPLTALYPAVTLVLSRLLLKEEITMSQSLGIAFALIAILLISTE